ncbi:MAG: hypothetical protein JST70_01805 [Bacteroidetes bacterium]|nr:hypothetical protein [Bacteroidota bacterium]
MKHILLSLLVFLLLGISSKASTDSLSVRKSIYRETKQKIENMLDGKEPLSFERAIYLIENAYWENGLDYEGFKQVLDFHLQNVIAIAQANDLPDSFYQPTLLQSTIQSKKDRSIAMENLRKNWAIYAYMTDTTVIYHEVNGWRPVLSLPFKYSYTDPMGTRDWQNTLVSHLLLTKRGNCFALASLYKILAERLGTDAVLSTAPSHIYITHRNEEGIPFNVELSNGQIAGTGTLATLTYTTNDAIRNNIALRELNLKQSVTLCLIYLAKSYEQEFGSLQDGFTQSCVDIALQNDDQSLNALLLKAEILENEIVSKGGNVAMLQKDQGFIEYQALITKLYKLGYREMPLDMKNTIIKGWTKDTFAHLFVKSNMPEAYNHSGVKNTRYASLSWGLFDEEIKFKPVEKFGMTIYNVKQQKIIRFENADRLYNNYNFDPVVFAWCIDPMAHEYPGLSPYSAFANNPIMFKDKGGAFVEGQDGKPVTYKMLTNGKISWSANATAEVKRIGGAMIKTETGREMFKKMQDTKYAIGFHLDNGKDLFGEFIPKGKWDDKHENFEVERGDLYVNTNRIAIFNWAYNKAGVEPTDEQGRKYYKLIKKDKNYEGVIGATGSHEADHATDQENINNWQLNQEQRQRGEQPTHDVETKPEEIENKDIDERLSR